MLRLWLFILAFAALPAGATVTVDGNLFYFSDSFATSTTSTYNRMLWDVAASINLTKKGQLMIGWDYNSASFTDNVNSVSTAVTVTGMGPKLAYYFDKDNKWDLAFTYDLLLKGNDSNGSNTPMELQGTGMKVELGYAPQVADDVYLGLKLNYYSASFSDTITNQTVLTQVSYHRTVIYPSIAFILRWD